MFSLKTTNPLTIDTEFPAAATLTNNFATPTAPGVGAFLMVYDGSAWDMALGDSTNGTLVNLGTNNDVVVRPDAYATDDTAMPATPVGFPVLGEYRSSATTYTDGDATVLQTDVNGNLKIVGTISSAVLDAGTSVGASTLFDADGDNTAQEVKSSAGAIYAIEVSNIDATDAFIQLFDVANGSITVGTTTPKLSFLVPAGDGTKRGAMDKIFTIPIKFATAINYACTTTATGNGDPTTGLIVNILYK